MCCLSNTTSSASTGWCLDPPPRVLQLRSASLVPAAGLSPLPIRLLLPPCLECGEEFRVRWFDFEAFRERWARWFAKGREDGRVLVVRQVDVAEQRSHPRRLETGARFQEQRSVRHREACEAGSLLGQCLQRSHDGLS